MRSLRTGHRYTTRQHHDRRHTDGESDDVRLERFHFIASFQDLILPQDNPAVYSPSFSLESNLSAPRSLNVS
jgi:hypothetical protein